MTDDLPPLPEQLIGAVERYADEVYEYNVAVKLDVGINEAGKICLAAETKYKEAIRAYGDARAAAAVAQERERWARICADMKYTGYAPDEHGPAADYYRYGVLDCAYAIRAGS